MIKNIATIATLSLLLASCGQDTSGENKSTGAAVMTTASLAGNIQTLSSDEFAGRSPGTPGEDKTVAFLVKAFKEAGLAPANGDSYVQNVPLVSIEPSSNAELSFSGGKGDAMQVTYIKDYVVTTRRLVERVDVQDSDLVFVGYGINAPERDWNDYEGLDVTGKTVVMLINDPGFATQDATVFNGNDMTYYGRWTYKYDEAARQGAAGVIIIHDSKPASYPFSVVQSGWTGPQFDMVSTDKGMGFSQFESWVSHDVASQLFNKAGLNLADLEAAASKKGFKAIALNMTASASIENTITYHQSRNVAAKVIGSETPDEAFVYMAHWDHLGVDPSIEGDGIYNGALDNATGTASLIEMAKAFNSLEIKPKRSILFLAVTAEEQGLLGSAYYAANPLVPHAKTVGGINIDSPNSFGPTHDIVVVGYGNSELDKYLESAATKAGRYISDDPHKERGYFYRSDHFSLSKQGVPTLFPGAGIDHIEKGKAYGIARGEDYEKNRYHQPSDEFDDSWDLNGQLADLELYFDTGFMIADSVEWPAWYDGTEFKAIREEQLAAKP